MSLYDTLRKCLTPELFTTVTDALGDDFDYDMVPRARLNKVIKQRNELRDQLAKGPQPSGGKTGEDDDDDDDIGAPKGKTKSEKVDIEALKKQWQQEQKDAVKEVKIQYAALEKLRAANVIDPDLIWTSSILDKSKIDLDDKGAITGLDEQLAQLKTDKAHLFKTGTEGVPGGTGKDGGEGGGDKGGTVSTREDFLKLSIEDQLKFKQDHPEVFKTFL